MKLEKIANICGQIKLLTGLHIGSGNTEMHIGGTDNPVIRNPLTQQPYIPGSSVKGKMRSLLEWYAGVIGTTNGKVLSFRDLKNIPKKESKEAATRILTLFGGAPEGTGLAEDAKKIGPARLAFWDCDLTE